MGFEDITELDKQALRVEKENLVAPIDIEAHVPHIAADRGWILNELDLGALWSNMQDRLN